MATRTLVSVNKLLHTNYNPDCGYVDGEVLERNGGEHDHALLQTLIAQALGSFSGSHRLLAFVEQRVRVVDSDTRKRYRIPDVLVVCRPTERPRSFWIRHWL